MKLSGKTFYYSRRKLGLYLLFNILLLTLAVLFTLTVFPEYPLVYFFAIGSCLLSVISALIVFLVPLPLAVITPDSIKIDRGDPLPWSAVRSLRKVRLGRGLFCKTILRLNPGKLGSYHMNLMQRITASSDFGAFSIPLYAMTAKDAQEIEQLIRTRLKAAPRTSSSAHKPAVGRKETAKRKSSAKRKTPSRRTV